MISSTTTNVILVIVVAIAIAGLGFLWETTAIKRFEKIEHRSLGLFQAERGEYYRRWGVEVPLVVSLIALTIYAISITYLTRHRRDPIVLAALWTASVAAAIGIWYYSAIVGMNGGGVVM